MPRVHVYLNKDRTPRCVEFCCPGCGGLHSLTVRPRTNGAGASWEFNGNLERPTLNPSILAKCGPFPAHDFDESFIIHGKKSQLNAERKLVCHSFVRDGQIQFLSDCTHDKAGMTIDLPEYVTGG